MYNFTKRRQDEWVGFNVSFSTNNTSRKLLISDKRIVLYFFRFVFLRKMDVKMPESHESKRPRSPFRNILIFVMNISSDNYLWMCTKVEHKYSWTKWRSFWNVLSISLVSVCENGLFSCSVVPHKMYGSTSPDSNEWDIIQPLMVFDCVLFSNVVQMYEFSATS